jgi:hypothetical protein
MKVLIDADMIAHEVGHLRETLKNEDGTPVIDPDTGLVVKGEHLPVKRVIDIAKGLLMSIIIGSQSGGWTAFLTRGRNVRHDIATIQPYKGHREDLDRGNVDHVKKALHEDLGAVWCDGREADDALATEMWSDLITVGSQLGYDDATLREHTATVIASRDKDLDTVPGWHYKWWIKGAKDENGVEIPEEIRKVEKGQAYWVTFIEAFRNFYKQLLVGDTSDNIKGLYGVGPKSAWVQQLDKIGTDVDLSDFEDIQDAEQEMYDHVEEKYIKHYGRNYGLTFLRENANLLHMHRRLNDTWLPPHERDEHYWYL